MVFSIYFISFEIYKNFTTGFLKKLNIEYKLVNLPKKKKRITLLKSPHVYKKAREQFESKVFNSLILIKNQNIKFNFLKFLIINKPKPLKIKILY
jgi:ribosomal protein S10